jgi:hypothetical protein
MEQSGTRARNRAQKEEQLEEDLARARMFIVGQRALFAGVGVTVQAMGDWGVKFQVGDNLVIDRGDVRFARMVNREIVRGCDVNARLLELVQDHYNIGAELQVTTKVPAAEAAQDGYALATALAAQVAAEAAWNESAPATAKQVEKVAEATQDASATAQGKKKGN